MSPNTNERAPPQPHPERPVLLSLPTPEGSDDIAGGYIPRW